MNNQRTSIHCDGCGAALEKKPPGMEGLVVVRQHTVLTKWVLDVRKEKRLCGTRNGNTANGCMATRHYTRAAQEGYQAADVFTPIPDQQQLLRS